MLLRDIKYSYNDIAIMPAVESNVEHRCECYPYKVMNGEANLPIFAAPMSTVVNEKNFSIFEENSIIPILPRNIDLNTRIEYLKRRKWVAVGLEEFKDLFLINEWDTDLYPVKVLIDIANGHMTDMHDAVQDAKIRHGRGGLTIMVGNIANPYTYNVLAEAGADYIRCSVGTGNGCLTWSNVGCGYPIASLIYEIYKIKRDRVLSGKRAPYIIADGGIRNYCDVNKALALGADYVMIGGLLSKLVESAAPTFYYDYENVKHYINNFDNDIEICEDGTFNIGCGSIVKVDNLHKVFYGMASRKGQEDINGVKSKTSEGVEKIFECTTTIKKWSENMADYIRTAMSYNDCFNIAQFNPEKVDCVIVSDATQKSINK